MRPMMLTELVSISHVSPAESLIALAMAHAKQLAPLGEHRELFARSKERIFGESPSINDPHGAAHQLREGRRGR